MSVINSSKMEVQLVKVILQLHCLKTQGLSKNNSLLLIKIQVKLELSKDDSVDILSY
jgi:hypothetical protein